MRQAWYRKPGTEKQYCSRSTRRALEETRNELRTTFLIKRLSRSSARNRISLENLARPRKRFWLHPLTISSSIREVPSESRTQSSTLSRH
ncbi:hypothetical protein TNIN_302341 [Trichonephila inaurata madagascariensis]|uniref:Uncharacterized protein n=1 Tax=Trichonephila inaurata madagascariensis TaxID=2747483 RepID=A0A8X7CU20_9ARAC|nr:hypothetical protein TNIN_302341 [Trichonephila inaurata madagascariensis]